MTETETERDAERGAQICTEKLLLPPQYIGFQQPLSPNPSATAQGLVQRKGYFPRGKKVVQLKEKVNQ